MKREEVEELHYITPIVNVPSILQHGLLSHNKAEHHKHESVAMREMQDRRQAKQIPGARPLHDYVNLYFDAHNPMLSKVRDQNNAICVLKVNPDILNTQGVIVADQNAASQWVRFYNVETGLAVINKETLRARYWTHADTYQQWIHASAKCAEVLVPDKVESSFIQEAYVANETALKALQTLGASLKVQIHNDIFF
jgi:hypothetical protein